MEIAGFGNGPNKTVTSTRTKAPTIQNDKLKTS
jgi:hypothetical protein